MEISPEYPLTAVHMVPELVGGLVPRVTVLPSAYPLLFIILGDFSALLDGLGRYNCVGGLSIGDELVNLLVDVH